MTFSLANTFSKNVRHSFLLIRLNKRFIHEDTNTGKNKLFEKTKIQIS